MLCYCCVICCVNVVSDGCEPTAALAQPTTVPIHDFEVQGFRIIGFVVVYGVSGLQMACAVNIVIHYDDISICPCTVAGSLFHGLDVTPRAVPSTPPCALGQTLTLFTLFCPNTLAL